MKTIRSTVLLPGAASAVVALLLADAACADRTAYARTVDLEASDDELIVHHHHDWSRVVDREKIEITYTLAEPFGVGNDYSYVSARAVRGTAQLWQVPSPPLSWLGVSADGRYIIGLSNVMLANRTQLVVFANDGRLLARRGISTTCSSRSAREAEIAGYPAEQRLVRREFATPQCLARGHVSESVTNYVHWYLESDPAPRVIENAGQVSAVDINGLNGKRMRVTFDPQTVRSQ